MPVRIKDNSLRFAEASRRIGGKDGRPVQQKPGAGDGKFLEERSKRIGA